MDRDIGMQTNIERERVAWLANWPRVLPSSSSAIMPLRWAGGMWNQIASVGLP